MKREDRAKQFMPFAALKGYDALIKKAEMSKCERRFPAEDAAEEINETIKALEPGDNVSVVWYCRGEEKSISGRLNGIDEFRKRLTINDCCIPIADIYELKR